MHFYHRQFQRAHCGYRATELLLLWHCNFQWPMGSAECCCGRHRVPGGTRSCALPDWKVEKQLLLHSLNNIAAENGSAQVPLQARADLGHAMVLKLFLMLLWEGAGQAPELNSQGTMPWGCSLQFCEIHFFYLLEPCLAAALEFPFLSLSALCRI